MEETEDSSKTRPNLTHHNRRNYYPQSYHFGHFYQHNHGPNRPFYHSNGVIGFVNVNHQQQAFPALLPLPLPPGVPFQGSFHHRPKTQFSRSLRRIDNGPESKVKDGVASVSAAPCEVLPNELRPPSTRRVNGATTAQELVATNRPDNGGVEGQVISLLANHFRVEFDPSTRIFHYDVEISPRPSKEVARMIKQKLVEEHSTLLSNACLAFDGRKNLYSPVQFQKDRLEFFVGLPVPIGKSCIETHDSIEHQQHLKLFKVNIRLVSKLDGKDLRKEGDEWIPLPQDYLHALDVVLRDAPSENSVQLGRSFYSSSMGGSKEIGGGAVGLRGFFQSLRPTQQGLALNVDFSVTAFYESIGVINYLQKCLEFLHDLPQRKTRILTNKEGKEVEKALKNIRVSVCHRESIQRYRVQSLTKEITGNLWFEDRNGQRLSVVNYFKDHYDYDIEFKNLPCLQISGSKPCYLPMELCMICDGQKFLGKLSDDQIAKLLNMGCQRPRERREIINGVMGGVLGPTSGDLGTEFKLKVSREMTRLNGRVLRPPKLKLGDGGVVRDITPTRLDRQWNLLGSHVVQGTRIERWTLISFGGTPDQKSNIPKFISHLSLRCEQLGIFLNKFTAISPQFEPIHVLNNVSLLESKLKKIQKAVSNHLQLLLCVMEKKHKGYSDLKRIAETRVGVVTQCCLYLNLAKLNSQFLSNLALKINAKVGGCTVALYSSLPSQIPRILHPDELVIFMGADVTHPHPLDDHSPSIAAVVGSMNWPFANKYASRIRSQTHREEIIEDLDEMVSELLTEFHQDLTKLPHRIIFFRDGVSETQFKKVLKQELQSIKSACAKFPSYKPLITFVVVQKRHHTRLFLDDKDPVFMQVSDENIPPGTVVDTVITHPKEFNFYLCSHWGVKGTSRPTHYHVLWDETRFTSDEFQKLVYSLCFTFVRCTKPISIVPPAYYAHLAAYRGRLYLDRSESIAGLDARRGCSVSRVASPKVRPLPKISDNVKKLMFYC